MSAPTITLQLSSIRRMAARRPPGYEEDVIAQGQIRGSTLVLPRPVYDALVSKYGGMGAQMYWGPRLDALLADYDGALAPWAQQGWQILPFAGFWDRLAKCRQCPLGYWTEDPADGYGRCEDVRRRCSRILIWSPQVTCSLPTAARQW